MNRLLSNASRSVWVLLGVTLTSYAVLAVVLWAGRDFTDEGPLAFDNPAAELDRATQQEIVRACFPDGAQQPTQKLVAGAVDGRAMYACYDLSSSGNPYESAVVEQRTLAPVTDPAVIKRAGVWPDYAVVKSVGDLTIGFVGLAIWILFVAYLLGRPPFRTMGTRGRVARVAMWTAFGFGLLLGLGAFVQAKERHDRWGVLVMSVYALATVPAGIVGARRREDPTAPAPDAPVPPPPEAARLTIAAPGAMTAAAPPPPPSPEPDLVRVDSPGTLPTFAQVGGMNALKHELHDTIGLLLAFSEHADAYRIAWNGILLHGRPGTGKTFMVKATAGEFGLNLLHVAAGDLVSAYRGESARNVEAVFRLAMRNVPCVLFFDEFDSIATRRDDNPDLEARRTVNQLLQSLERTRHVRELIVMAATNDLGSLDPAIIRPGRFDRHIHVALPDVEARESILAAQLDGRPGGDAIGLAELGRRTEGLTPAALAQVVSAASLEAMQEAAESPTGQIVPLTTERLLRAVRERGGRDRPSVERWTWDRLILPNATKAELRQLAALASDPDLAERYGIEPPSGVLLYGPPGTGKTTVAKVLAAEARCSFYAVSSADLTSKWLGESERLVAQLFDRARDNRPSIVFIDEIDAIAGTRGTGDTYDRQVNQLLQEIDGVESTPGILVVGATNRRDIIDPALLRGGRLSRHIEIPLPDRDARVALLRLFTGGMPLEGIDLDELATRTDGWSGADLEGLCQDAGVQAMIRGGEPSVTSADVAAAYLARTGKPLPLAAMEKAPDGGYL